MAWKSGLKVPLLPLGPSYPLQTILLGDLFGCGGQLQIVMAVLAHFFKFVSSVLFLICSVSNSHYSLQRAPTPDPASSNFKKVRQSASTICVGLLYPTGWATQPSEDISHCCFLGQRNPLRI